MSKYTYPLRLGRKQGRAVLDANGLEVVILPKGSEHLAKLIVELLNQEHSKSKELPKTDQRS